MELLSKDEDSFYVPIKMNDSETVSINSFKKWKRAFRVYDGIYSKQHPHRAWELIEHINNIEHAAGTFHVYIYIYIYIYMCDAQWMLMGGSSHTHWLTAPAKQSALGHQLKGTAVLQKGYWLRSEWHSWASLEYLSACDGTHLHSKNTS